MKRFYFVIVYGKIGVKPGIINVSRGYEKYWSFVDSCTDCDNMLCFMEKIEEGAKRYGFDVTSINLSPTKKAAENLAEFWNDGWKKQGKLYDWFKEV